MKTVCILLLLSFTLGVTIFTNSARAQENKDQAAKPAESEADTKTVPPPQTSTNQKSKSDRDKAREVFKPSEEISEDFAVSFPVDI